MGTTPARTDAGQCSRLVSTPTSGTLGNRGLTIASKDPQVLQAAQNLNSEMFACVDLLKLEVSYIYLELSWLRLARTSDPPTGHAFSSVTFSPQNNKSSVLRSC